MFECQLTPNLINVVRSGDAPAEGEGDAKAGAEARAEREKGRDGMEWGTCMVFSCERDCSDGPTAGCWAEELVLVQWDE